MQLTNIMDKYIIDISKFKKINYNIYVLKICQF